MTKEVPRHSLPTESVSLSWKNRGSLLEDTSYQIAWHFSRRWALCSRSESIPASTPPQFHTHFSISRGVGNRLAAILLEIDANELNNVFASQDFIIFKIGKIGNYLCTLSFQK